MPKTAKLSMAVLAIMPVACARTPDVAVSYYLPRADVQVRVLQTVMCNDKDEIITAYSAEPTTKYSASSEARQVRIKDLDGPLSDAGLTFEFYDDGRLKTVNATTDGKGEDIAKAGVTLLTTLAGRALAVGARKFPAQCKEIRARGKGEPITITYQTSLPLDAFKEPGARNPEPPHELRTMYWPVTVDEYATPYYIQVASAVAGVCAVIAPPVARTGVAASAAKVRGDVELGLVQPAEVEVSLHRSSPNLCTAAEAAANPSFWRAKVLAPQLGRGYVVLIPGPAAFGKQVFALALSEAGTVTKLQYDKSTGLTQVLGAANAFAGAAITTDAEETARLNEEAARIAAQAKIVKCRADVTQC